MSDGNGTETRRKAPGEAAGTRREHDAYDTPPTCALGCMKWLRDSGMVTWPGHAPNILDPMAGGGPFVAAADVVFPDSKIVAVDIRPECAASYAGARAKFVNTDAFVLPPGLIAQCDLIATNPAFKIADRLVRHLWPHMKDGATLALLLNLTFMGTEDRWDLEPSGLFKLAKPRSTPQIIPRPSFMTIDGKEESPKFEAALFVWTKGYVGPWEIPDAPVRWEKPKKERTRKPRAPKNGAAP